jgi:hypothetical protein
LSENQGVTIGVVDLPFFMSTQVIVGAAPLALKVIEDKYEPLAQENVPLATPTPGKPCGPATPIGPWAPVSPLAPVAPVAPVSPFNPWIPWIP